MKKENLEAVTENKEQIDSASIDVAEIARQLTEIANEILTVDNIGIDTSFEENGVDSISFIKTVVAIEDRFNIEFEDDYLYIEALPTIAAMVEYVKSQIS